MRQLYARADTMPRLTWWANVVTDAGHHGGGPLLGRLARASPAPDARLGAFLDHLDAPGRHRPGDLRLDRRPWLEGSDPAVRGSWTPALDVLSIPYRDEGPAWSTSFESLPSCHWGDHPAG